MVSTYTTLMQGRLHTLITSNFSHRYCLRKQLPCAIALGVCSCHAPHGICRILLEGSIGAWHTVSQRMLPPLFLLPHCERAAPKKAVAPEGCAHFFATLSTFPITTRTRTDPAFE